MVRVLHLQVELPKLVHFQHSSEKSVKDDVFAPWHFRILQSFRIGGDPHDLMGSGENGSVWINVNEGSSRVLLWYVQSHRDKSAKIQKALLQCGTWCTWSSQLFNNVLLVFDRKLVDCFKASPFGRNERMDREGYEMGCQVTCVLVYGDLWATCRTKGSSEDQAIFGKRRCSYRIGIWQRS